MFILVGMEIKQHNINIQFSKHLTASAPALCLSLTNEGLQSMTSATVALGQTCSRPIECDALNPCLRLWFSKSVAPAGGQYQDNLALMRNAKPCGSLQIKPSMEF